MAFFDQLGAKIQSGAASVKDKFRILRDRFQAVSSNLRTSTSRSVRHIMQLQTMTL